MYIRYPGAGWLCGLKRDGLFPVTAVNETLRNAFFPPGMILEYQEKRYKVVGLQCLDSWETGKPQQLVVL